MSSYSLNARLTRKTRNCLKMTRCPNHSLFGCFIRTLLGAALLVVANIGSAEEGSRLAFNRDIRPILSDKCFACHGLDANKRQADLRLDIAEGALANHDGHQAIVPGDWKSSELWLRITSTDESTVMPPSESHKALTDAEKETIRLWIEQGANYQKHWAFEPIQAATMQAPVNASENPIDYFIGKRLDEEGLAFSQEADRNILIRRVSFALTGLPPSLADRDNFLSDDQPGAYERMVDRYLASQQFGEEMARHWLDVARYADTHGMHLDNERQMWAYRDWVVNAFNRNLPFDQFTIEQLAGDLLPNPTTEQLVATGFNRCNVTSSEGGSIDDELIFRYAVDRTSTTAQTWLGLTAGCAVCHDHKFDPISQKEFYSLYAFFNSAADPAMDGNALLTQPVIALEDDDYRKKIAEFEKSIGEQQQQLDQIAKSVTYTDPATADPKPTAQKVDHVWMEDEFPAGGNVVASPGHPTMFVTVQDGGQVFSGTKSVKRTDAGLAQDVWDQSTVPLTIPQDAVMFAYVWLDPQSPPKSIMLQYHKSGWQHRAVWGDYEAIPWGAVNTTERVAMGPLPEVGGWQRLEFPADKVGLAAGDKLTGFAITQFGGTVYWDHVGVQGVVDPSSDPSLSFLAWWKQSTGKDVAGLPAELNAIAKQGPEANFPEPDRQRLLSHYLQSACTTTRDAFAEPMSKITELQKQKQMMEQSLTRSFVYRDMPQPRPSFVMIRGAYDKRGEPVEPNVPAVFPPLKLTSEKARPTRLDLANWILDQDNPLTARVTVNRIWQQFFGTGLVKSSYDFGSQGESPSHPELLDTLASDFKTTGWDVKNLVRRIINSKTFRQSSTINPQSYSRDPENRLLARGPRFRLDAEQLRDNALFISGLLDMDMGGKGVKTYQPENIWEPVGFAGSNTRFYQRDNGASLYRRSIYVFLKRTAPPPFMSNFDAPNREQFCTRRERSNTPLQALQLMNDVQHVEAARVFAQRMLIEGGNSPESRFQFAFRSVLSREATPTELEILRNQLNDHLARYQANVESATKLTQLGETKPDTNQNVSELAAYTLIANTIFNLDETVTRN
jgi:Protein of unknown function (DUF1553)/Protein of unknown function (DUF1549)/Planctomycete cytochrome C